ncbi:hypothetical protein FKW77_008449 [Venturia effusa]|uniref:Cytochrome b561 domain-containing protein n=1 Tax=Venturia effusa TaxID=50376 RepID=A0A517LHS2_9PEZI|nr:hypothetical protein FKW77_008449 [Venturia effusa]
MNQHNLATILLLICEGVLGHEAHEISSRDSPGALAVAFHPGLDRRAPPRLNRKLFKSVKLTHGVMAAMAFAAFFPLGAIAIRTFPGRLALVAHLGLQFLAYAFFTAAVGMGMWMSQTLEPFGADFWNHHHVIIGLTVFGLLAVQAVLGILHHLMYRRKGRRQIWSYAHIWTGRSLITLGIINGGLGMEMAHVSRPGKIAYGVCAGLIWIVWMFTAVASEFRTSGRADNQPRSEK